VSKTNEDNITVTVRRQQIEYSSVHTAEATTKK
jgi:hypothetical protein